MIRIRTLFLLLFSMCALFVYSNDTADGHASHGVLDLRSKKDFTQAVTLNGDWNFYWHQLLSPNAVPKTDTVISFPSLWKDVTYHGGKLPTMGFATYKLTILLAPEAIDLALEVPDTYCSYRLYVNGNLLSENGSPSTDKKTATPFWTTKTIDIGRLKDTLEVVMHVSNFWHAKGGTYKPLLLGDSKTLFSRRDQLVAGDFLLMGCIMMGGLFFLGLYFFSRHDKAYIYFSLFCLFYSYRIIGTKLYPLHSFFPDLSWFITIRLEYLSLSLSVAFFAKYSGALFPKDVNAKLIRWMEWFCYGYSLIVLLFPPIVFTNVLILFLLAMFALIGYAFFIYIKAAKNKRPGSLYALLSTLILMLVFILINLQYFGFIPYFRGLVYIGYLSFFFLQSLILSFRFANTLKEKAKEAQQGLKAKSEFLSTMSHEIRTPLNSVIGMTHLLQRSNPRDDQKQNLNVLLFSANNLLAIVNNILDYSKIEEGKISLEKIPVDLPAIAENIVHGMQTIAADKGINLQLKVDSGIDRKVFNDPTRISQVINNLVYNAIKFTEKGSVELALKVNHRNDHSINITVRVTDTGIGIPEDKQKLIFERFTQADSSHSRSYGGTGLGLAISKLILELQGSRLELESEVGKGSSFFFTQTFELTDEKVGSGKQYQAQIKEDTRPLENVQILLVEDTPLNVMVAQTFLQRCGAKVDVAVNGEEALQKMEATGKYQLVLMDLHMPVMDGYQATRELRKRGESLPIIALTASLPKEVESEVHAAGLTDIVVKPFNPDDLFRVILQHLPAKAA